MVTIQFTHTGCINMSCVSTVPSGIRGGGQCACWERSGCWESRAGQADQQGGHRLCKYVRLNYFIRVSGFSSLKDSADWSILQCSFWAHWGLWEFLLAYWVLKQPYLWCLYLTMRWMSLHFAATREFVVDRSVQSIHKMNPKLLEQSQSLPLLCRNLPLITCYTFILNVNLNFQIVR